MNWMLYNSGGKKDGCWTFAVVSFVITTLMVLLSVFKSFSFMGVVIELNEPNIALLTLYFGGAFTSYVVRRHTKDNVPQPTPPQVY